MTIQDFVNRGLDGVKNMYGEIHHNSINSIMFPNGWVASIIDKEKYPFMTDILTRYSVAVRDQNGYFYWDKLIPFGAVSNAKTEHFGCYLTDTEEDVCNILSIIEKMEPDEHFYDYNKEEEN